MHIYTFAAQICTVSIVLDFIFLIFLSLHLSQSLFLCQTHPKSTTLAHQITHIQIHKESSKTHIAKKKKTDAEKEKDEVKKKKGIKDPFVGVAGGSCTIFDRELCGGEILCPKD